MILILGSQPFLLLIIVILSNVVCFINHCEVESTPPYLPRSRLFHVTNPWIVQGHHRHPPSYVARLSEFRCNHNPNVCKSKWVFGDGGACCAGGVCKNTWHDSKNCGGCGKLCPDTCCGGQCVDLNVNVQNCGSCAHSCGPGSTCELGMCGYDTPDDEKCGVCLPSTTCCIETGECANLDKDVANCGQCGNQCSEGQICMLGICKAHCGICLPTETCCDDGKCVSLDDDADNCGSCGSQCSQRESCILGMCKAECGICLPVETCCDDGNCVNLDDDADNCGSCGNQCSQRESCILGMCKAQCGLCLPTETCCSDANCVNLNDDSNNCGSCGNQCSKRESCRHGICEGLNDVVFAH